MIPSLHLFLVLQNRTYIYIYIKYLQNHRHQHQDIWVCCESHLLTAVEFIRAISAVLQPIAVLRVVVTGPISTCLLSAIWIVCKKNKTQTSYLTLYISIVNFGLTSKYSVLSSDVKVLLQLFSSELSTQSFTWSHLYLPGIHWPSWQVNWSGLQVRPPEPRACDWV